MCVLLLAAGHETTANLIGNGAIALFERPEQLDWLARNPERSLEAVDELLATTARSRSPRASPARTSSSAGLIGEGEQALVVSARRTDPAQDPSRNGWTSRAPPSPPRLRPRSPLLPRCGPRPAGGAGDVSTPRRSPLRPEPDTWSYARDDSHAFRRLKAVRLGTDRAPKSGGAVAVLLGLLLDQRLTGALPFFFTVTLRWFFLHLSGFGPGCAGGGAGADRQRRAARRAPPAAGRRSGRGGVDPTTCWFTASVNAPRAKVRRSYQVARPAVVFELGEFETRHRVGRGGREGDLVGGRRQAVDRVGATCLAGLAASVGLGSVDGDRADLDVWQWQLVRR